MRTFGLIAAVILVIGALALLTFCAQPKPGGGPVMGGLFAGSSENRQQIEKARAAVQAKMQNPQSATFSDVGLYNFKDGAGETHKVVCGYVDGADGTGQMVGRQRFMAAAAGAVLEAEAPQGIAEAWSMSCQDLVLRDSN